MLVLDLELENRAGGARWALLPASLPRDDGGVFAVEALRASDPGGVDAALALGRGGRLAVRVAAGSRIRLRDARVQWWGPLPLRLEVQIDLADDVWVDGRPLDSWMDDACTLLQDGADVSFSRSEVVSSRMTEGLAPVSLELHEAAAVEHLVVSVDLASAAHDLGGRHA